jgi:hypothetical protein
VSLLEFFIEMIAQRLDTETRATLETRKLERVVEKSFRRRWFGEPSRAEWAFH